MSLGAVETKLKGDAQTVEITVEKIIMKTPRWSTACLLFNFVGMLTFLGFFLWKYFYYEDLVKCHGNTSSCYFTHDR